MLYLVVFFSNVLTTIICASVAHYFYSKTIRSMTRLVERAERSATRAERLVIGEIHESTGIDHDESAKIMKIYMNLTASGMGYIRAMAEARSLCGQ